MAVFCLFACRPAGAPPTLKIGLVAPFEGLHRPLGYEALFGVKLALQERNLDRGLNGHRIELVALNDFDDPAEAQIQARALAADPDVLGVVGHLSSGTTLAARPVYLEANLAMSVPWTVQAGGLQVDRSGLALVAAGESVTAGRLEAIARESGFNQIVSLTHTGGAPLPPGVQAIQLATDGVAAGEIILALQQANISLPLFGQADAGSPQLVQVAKTAANGLIFVSPGPAPRDVGADDFIEAYRALAGFPPGPRAVLAYDAAHVLLDAIEQAMLEHDRRPTRSEVSAVIARIQRNGVSGNLAFDAQGRRLNAPVWVYQIAKEEYPGALMAPR